MASRQRRAHRRSSPSNSRGNKPTDLGARGYFRQDEVLKPTSAGLDEDNYPMYLLEAATVYSLDGKRIENLLDVGVKGTVEVRGRLTILPEEAEISHLRTPQRNGQWIAFPCDAFSFGWGPSAIWALGDRKWFEIQPSSEYKTTYAKMTEGVAVYYYLTELYEQLAKRLTRYPIDNLFLLYAELEGNNLTADVIRERVKNHAKFLLTQMAKRSGNVNWTSTSMFKWLVGECPDIQRAVLEKINLLPVPQPNGRPQTSETPVLAPSHSRPDSMPKDAPDSSSPSPVAELGRRHITTHGDPSTAEVIVRTMQELAKDHQAPDKITMATVWTALYHDLQLELAQAKVIFRCHAQLVLESLDQRTWGKSQVYRELAMESSEAGKDLDQRLPKMSEKERKSYPSGSRAKEFADYGPTAMTIKLRPRKSAGERRRPVKKSLTLNPASHGATDDWRVLSPSAEPDETRPTRSGKAVPAMPRGKNAILRPSGALATQYSTDTSSGQSINPDHSLPVGMGGRGRKRKAIEPEMGDISDDEAMWDAMDDVLQREIMDDAVDEEDLYIKLVDISLPSTDPTGPNGSWVCPKQYCSTVVHDSSSEEGKLTIRKHLYSHADPEVMQYLVETETQKHGGIKTQYLLEKIRQIGASKRMEDEAEEAGKIRTVKPIKRAGI